MADETATLAAYVANLKFEDIPREVLERAKVLTLDFLGSAIRARRDAESTPSLLKMLEALALDGSGESTVFGDSKTWTPAVAALLNGALGHSLDFDDTHADSSLHPSAVSYTHLRAHETRHDLVCRLLLEKKKKNTKKTITHNIPNKKNKNNKKKKTHK